jgi:peptidoglycan/LPS O-acetylase OafA/YrhL
MLTDKNDAILAEKQPTQWKILAGLRFFLAFIVLCVHLHLLLPEVGKPWRTFYYLSGFSAVLGFLVISGYSIAHSITQNPEGFYKRRFLRIYPLYFCSIIVSLIPFLLLGSKIKSFYIGIYEQLPLDSWTILGNLVFMQGFLVKYLGSNPPVWTISIECFCYLLAPLFVKLGSKKLLILIALSSVLFALYPRYITMLPFGLTNDHYSFTPYGLSFIVLLWAWLLGFFYFVCGGKDTSKILLIALGSILLELNHKYNSRWGISTYVLSTLILIYSPYLKFPSSVLNFFNYLGELSYPLYLFHVPSLIFCYSVLGIQNPFALVCFSLGSSIFFYHAIDKPFRSKKHQLTKKLSRIV